MEGTWRPPKVSQSEGGSRGPPHLPALSHPSPNRDPARLCVASRSASRTVQGGDDWRPPGCPAASSASSRRG
eukprot:10548899-Alexandrium_andersonii.AAC.1